MRSASTLTSLITLAGSQAVHKRRSQLEQRPYRRASGVLYPISGSLLHDTSIVHGLTLLHSYLIPQLRCRPQSSPRSLSHTHPTPPLVHSTMSKHLTEQTPLLRRTHNVPVDVDVDVERGDRKDTCRTSSEVPVAALVVREEADHAVEGGGGGGDGRTTTTTTTTTTTMAMTPIPWRQLLTLCLVRLVDPICFSQIFPYINDMLLDMGVVGPNEPERVGFYSGLIESAFSVAVAVAIYPWARLSGTSGRRYPTRYPPSPLDFCVYSYSYL